MTDDANTNQPETDLVSVIVPVYNTERYLRTCIDSIICQTHGAIEIILIDDGSDDSSGAVCDEYARSDNRIRAIHTGNSGPAAARNAGIQHSQGKFLFFLDSDDYIEQNALALLIANYRKHKADIVVGDFRGIEDNNPGPGHKGVFPGDRLLARQDIMDYARSYLRKPNRFTLFAYSWGRLLKSSIIKENNIRFNTDLHTFEDVAFNFDYLNYTNEVFFLKEPIYNHLIHDNYISATMRITDNPRKLFGYQQALAHIGDYLKNCRSNADIRKEVGHAYVCLTIIQWVRTCGQINSNNEKIIYELIREMVNDSHLRDSLQFYSPSNGDSRILPVLIRLRFVRAIITVCKYKANKRYGKGLASK